MGVSWLRPPAVLTLAAASASAADVTVSVDPAADRRTVSPYVFGVNFASGATLSRMNYPANRWGANATPRYSWVYETSNRGSDWFFFDIPEDNAHPELLPDGSAADVFVDDTRAAGAEPLLTVPTIGLDAERPRQAVGLLAPQVRRPAGDGVHGSTLAQAEALAIFAHEGVHFASRWVVPDDYSRIEDAFSLYLSYDGAGARAQGPSVRATSTNVDQVGACAIVSPSNLLYLLLFDQDTSARTVSASVAGGLSGTFELYRFTAVARLGSAGTTTPSRGVLNLTLPARSATLAVGTLPVAPPPAVSFYTLRPCRPFDTRQPVGAFGGPALAAKTERSFALAGRCGIPATARALSFNVTATVATVAGNVVLFPDGTSYPSSTLNYAAGATRANNGVVGLGAVLRVRSNQSSGTVQLLLDVNGYFE